MKNYLTEAFKKLDILDEDVFDIDSKGIAELKDFEDTDEVETVQIIDPKAENEEELSDSYIGKVILDCCVCHSKIYEEKEDVKISEDEELANVGEECPYCYSSDGFKIIGQVCEYCPECEKESEEDKEEHKDDEVEVEVKEKEEITEAVSKRDDIDAEADNKKERIKKAYLRARDDADADRDYRLKRRITRKTEGKCLKEEPVYGLEPRYDARKSFYGKAQVDTGDKGDKNKLYSYDTLVAEIKDGKPYVYGTNSQTTLRHIKDWLKQNGFKAESGKQIMADYGADIDESLESVSVDTGEQIIDISAHSKEEVVEEKEETEETVEPISDETKDEIIANSEDDEVEVDVSEFDTDEFDELGESYLKRAYSNVESYNTTKVSNSDNLLKLEGVIKFTSGNTKKTSFIFESKEITDNGKAKFIGENAQICKGRKAFTVTGTLKEKKFLPESFNYNYKAKDANTGISKRIYGTIKNKR